MTAPGSGPPFVSSGDSADGDELDRSFVAGQVLFERYEVIERLGRGGMGEVYKVRDTNLDNAIRALKRIQPSELSADAIRRFRSEARVMARLNHPHIVSLHYHDFKDPKRAYIVMDFLDGVSLDQILRDGRPMPLDWTGRILRQLCDVLKTTHEQSPPIIHRDLKPSNLMLLSGREPKQEFLKVLDFGLAKELRQADPSDRSIYVGTPRYSSPEQFQSKPLDARSDLYTVGVILYEMLSGHRLFDGTRGELYEKHTQKRPPPFFESNPTVYVPAEIESVVLECLEKDPALRPQSARELADRFLGAVARASMHIVIDPPSTVTPPVSAPRLEPTPELRVDVQGDGKAAPQKPGRKPREFSVKVRFALGAIGLVLLFAALFTVWRPERVANPGGPPLRVENILQTILDDVRSQPAANRPFVRYFSVRHVGSTDPQSGLLDLHRQALVQVINLVSKGKAPIHPAAIDSEKTIFRVDLRELGWDEQPFEVFHNKKPVRKSPVNRFDLVLLEYPYGIVPEGSKAFTALLDEFLVPAAQARPVVFVRADWFIFAAPRTPLVDDLRGVYNRKDDAGIQSVSLALEGRELLEKVARDYSERPVTLGTAAAELGLLNPGVLKSSLANAHFSGRTPFSASDLVSRQDWETSFPSVVRALGLGRPIPPLESISRLNVRSAKDAAPLSLASNKKDNVFRPGDDMLFRVKNDSPDDYTVELVGTGISGGIVVLTDVPVLVRSGEELVIPPPNENPIRVGDKTGTERLTAFASAPPFAAGELLRGEATADRFVHERWRDSLAGLRMMESLDLFKTSILLETRPKDQP